MVLENVTENLLAYKELEPGTFLHVDQLTNELRTNPDLRNQAFYTADGQLYTVQKGKPLWAITREPQNLVLQNIDEAYRQMNHNYNANYLILQDLIMNCEDEIYKEDLKYTPMSYRGNYFPSSWSGRRSLEHEDTVVIDMKGLGLERSGRLLDYFIERFD